MWAPAVGAVLVAFLLTFLFEKLMFFAPWSAAPFLCLSSAWPLSFQKTTWQKALQGALFFAAFVALFLAAQLCYVFTVIPSIGPLISFVPVLFILFIFVALALLWPAIFFLREIRREELLRIAELFREKPRESVILFAISFGPLALSGLLYSWARATVFALYGSLGIYGQLAALWPFLLLTSLGLAFFVEMAKQVKR